MKKLKLKLDGREMLSKEQMKKISGSGDYGPLSGVCTGFLTCYGDIGFVGIFNGYVSCSSSPDDHQGNSELCSSVYESSTYAESCTCVF